MLSFVKKFLNKAVSLVKDVAKATISFFFGTDPTNTVEETIEEVTTTEGAKKTIKSTIIRGAINGLLLFVSPKLFVAYFVASVATTVFFMRTKIGKLIKVAKTIFNMMDEVEDLEEEPKEAEFVEAEFVEA